MLLTDEEAELASQKVAKQISKKYGVKILAISLHYNEDETEAKVTVRPAKGRSMNFMASSKDKFRTVRIECCNRSNNIDA